MEAWPAALEALALARALGESAWLYPLVNAGHILGIALLLGAIIPLDLRLLGLWREVALVPLWTVLGRTAACGVALAVACGSLLFITRATEYVASALFVAKMAFVAAGVANALWLRLRAGDPLLWPGATPPLHARAAAAISLAVWPTAMVLGRWIGYS